MWKRGSWTMMESSFPWETVGEIVHRSGHVMTGYLNDPEKTAEAFEFGWFHSGDLGRFDEDGYLYVVDRKKDMIKTGGENVASREVEEVLYQYPGIEEVAVIGLPDPKWIEIVAAVAVPKKGVIPQRQGNYRLLQRTAGRI
ncbi:MAG: AMP-binding protein [Desulfobacterales bacterium]|nr:AMP-binding protein [Desulfobacterales bacterium]